MRLDFLNTSIDKSGIAYVEINEEAAGLFLVLCGHVDLAREIANAKI